MEKLKMHSPNQTDDSIARIRELFPNCVTEAKDEEGIVRYAVDFDQLRQELSSEIVEGPQERYQLSWPGKREALLASNAPIAKTLRPNRKESVNFDATRNLFIEGDNLEALKLLQEIYLGAVKLIYIDPPYNTGNDFVYDDDFANSADEYLIRSNQEDASGRKLLANPSSNGRFHSDWLSMIYARLRIARKLLAEDGILVASIDENEVDNLRKIGDDVFGPSNFLFQITVLSNPKGRSQDKYVANCHEYLIGYSKNALPKGAVNIPKDEEEIEENYKLVDERGRYRELELRNTHREFGKHNRPNLCYPFYVSEGGKFSLEKLDGYTPVLPDWDDGFKGCWTWGIDKARDQLQEIVAKRIKGEWKIFRKNYAEDEDGEATKQVKSIWTDKRFHTEKGQEAFNDLFESKEKIFQSPKSVEMLRQVLLMGTRKDSLVLDFFAGSGSTAHAVIKQNCEDGGSRRFILVQIDDPTPAESEARKAGFETIADICKARIRHVGERTRQDLVSRDGIDVGFRALKIDSSNMADTYYQAVSLKQDDLLTSIESIKPERSNPEDLLFQVLVDWGVDLTLPIRKESVKGKSVFFVNVAPHDLIACFDGGVSEELVKELAKYKPVRIVFRDNGFESDAVKINVEQIFKQLSPSTDVKSI